METNAAALMSSPLITIPHTTSLRDAAAILSRRRMSGAPVVDRRRRPIGVVSLLDIVTRLAGLERPADEPGGFYRFTYPDFRETPPDERDLDDLTVCDIMTPEIISVPETMTVFSVAKALWERHVHRVFVTRKGRIVGVISTMDVLQYMTGGKTVGRKAVKREPKGRRPKTR